jgi:formylmethanofuran dehydrogenase subunit E
MKTEEILGSPDFKRCESFHGHICPGLALGFRSARMALDHLNASPAADEEVVAVVETDACSADAVQVLTGCTFGKGNFIYKDYGKMALTLFSRETGRGVRVALRSEALQPDAEHQALLQKLSAGSATEPEKRRFRELHHRRTCEVLAMPAEQLFTLTPVETELPARARVEPSQPCARCGEPTMPSKMETKAGQRLCRGCLE